LVALDPLHVTTLPDYLFVYTRGLPQRLLAWPIAVLLYLVAVGSALLGSVRREDGRVTGGLLVFAGVSHLRFTLGLGRPGLLAIPVGTILLWTGAWWFYWSDLRTVFWK
jgi:uncharacterized protein (TIGR04206 family)